MSEFEIQNSAEHRSSDMQQPCSPFSYSSQHIASLSDPGDCLDDPSNQRDPSNHSNRDNHDHHETQSENQQNEIKVLPIRSIRAQQLRTAFDSFRLSVDLQDSTPSRIDNTPDPPFPRSRNSAFETSGQSEGNRWGVSRGNEGSKLNDSSERVTGTPAPKLSGESSVTELGRLRSQQSQLELKLSEKTKELDIASRDVRAVESIKHEIETERNFYKKELTMMKDKLNQIQQREERAQQELKVVKSNVAAERISMEESHRSALAELKHEIANQRIRHESIEEQLKYELESVRKENEDDIKMSIERTEFLELQLLQLENERRNERIDEQSQFQKEREMKENDYVQKIQFLEDKCESLESQMAQMAHEFSEDRENFEQQMVVVENSIRNEFEQEKQKIEVEMQDMETVIQTLRKDCSKFQKVLRQKERELVAAEAFRQRVIDERQNETSRVNHMVETKTKEFLGQLEEMIELRANEKCHAVKSKYENILAKIKHPPPPTSDKSDLARQIAAEMEKQTGVHALTHQLERLITIMAQERNRAEEQPKNESGTVFETRSRSHSRPIQRRGRPIDNDSNHIRPKEGRQAYWQYPDEAPFHQTMPELPDRWRSPREKHRKWNDQHIPVLPLTEQMLMKL